MTEVRAQAFIGDDRVVLQMYAFVLDLTLLPALSQVRLPNRRSQLKALSRKRMAMREAVDLFCPECGSCSRGRSTTRMWLRNHIRTQHAHTPWFDWASAFRQKEAHYFSVPPPAGVVRVVLPRADWPIPEGWHNVAYVVKGSRLL